MVPISSLLSSKSNKKQNTGADQIEIKHNCFITGNEFVIMSPPELNFLTLNYRVRVCLAKPIMHGSSGCVLSQVLQEEKER